LMLRRRQSKGDKIKRSGGAAAPAREEAASAAVDLPPETRKRTSSN
jgi:hypothetical protein